MSTRLESMDGAGVISLDRPLILLGRHSDCDVRLDSRRVSRHHCCLARVDGGLAVRDLGSTNGTRINGRRISIGLLRPGDELTVGRSRYRLCVTPSTSPTPVPISEAQDSSGSHRPDPDLDLD